MLTTTRVSIARTRFGAVHFTSGNRFAGNRSRSTAYSSALNTTARLRNTVFAAAAVPSIFSASWSSTPRSVVRSPSRDTFTVFVLSHTSAPSIADGLSISRRTVLNAQPVMGRDRSVDRRTPVPMWIWPLRGHQSTVPAPDRTG